MVSVAATTTRPLPLTQRERRDRVYTARLQKGGALLADMRALMIQWDGTPETAARIVSENTLGHSIRSRVRDIVERVFVPRFVRTTPPDLWRALAVFERAGVDRDVLVAQHFDCAAEQDALLTDVLVWLRDDRGLLPGNPVAVEDVLRFIALAPASSFPNGRWAPIVAVKVARGLLAALRDFGFLAGSSKKVIGVASVPPMAFAWIARLRFERGTQGIALLRDPVWRRYGWSEREVERKFLDAHQRGMLMYHAAGSVVRVAFPPGSMEDYARALVEGTA